MPDNSVAFIGLGAMGLPMAARLLSAGVTVRGFDISEAARAGLTAAGGQAFPSPDEAVVGGDVVVLMLPDSTVVEAVMAQIRGRLKPTTLVIDMSSSEPLRTRQLADDLHSEGVDLIDAPVSGGVKGARAGTLTIMVGGEPAQVDRARGLLAHLGVVKHAGPVGAGHAVKALNNLLSATHLWVTSEAILAGEKFGLDPGVLLEIINGSSGRSGSTENKWPNFILPGTFDSGFALRLMLKDMRIAADLARQVGLPSELGEAAIEHWARADQRLGPGADHTEVARCVADRSSPDEPDRSD
ncbi:NAD(P)-dependent oxidoreductase [Micromonospora sp. NPDC005806]|uniref:NAD(P)-dependent oxidoreductase n=1 Tax=Micromonospora sp. NPDC005806 TaxID=3364234 RepID=UPI0036ABD093